MPGENLRKGGPIGSAPSAGTGTMSQTKAVTANTTARQAPAHQNTVGGKGKDTMAFKSPGELGAKGHGGA